MLPTNNVLVPKRPIALLIAVVLFQLMFSNTSSAAEQLYTHQPAVTPELAFSGPYAVGVKTITATDPKRLNTGNFLTKTRRDLILEVWYPAVTPKPSNNDWVLATYKNVTRLQKPFELQGAAYRDAPALPEGDFQLLCFPMALLAIVVLCFI